MIQSAQNNVTVRVFEVVQLDYIRFSYSSPKGHMVQIFILSGPSFIPKQYNTSDYITLAPFLFLRLTHLEYTIHSL